MSASSKIHRRPSACVLRARSASHININEPSCQESNHLSQNLPNSHLPRSNTLFDFNSTDLVEASTQNSDSSCKNDILSAQPADVNETHISSTVLKQSYKAASTYQVELQESFVDVRARSTERSKFKNQYAGSAISVQCKTSDSSDEIKTSHSNLCTSPIYQG